MSVNYGVPAGNTGQLNVADGVYGGGNILDTPGTTPPPNIATQIRNLKKAARKLTGYPLAHAFYGQNVLDYLLDNNKVKEMMKFNPAANARTLAGETPQGLFGLQWHPAYEAFYEDETGVDAGSGRRRPGALHPRAVDGLARLAGRDLPGADERRGDHRRCDRRGRARVGGERDVQLRAGDQRPGDGEAGGRRYVPAGAEGAEGGVRGDGEVLMVRGG